MRRCAACGVTCGRKHGAWQDRRHSGRWRLEVPERRSVDTRPEYTRRRFRGQNPMVTIEGFAVRIPEAMYSEMVTHIVAGYPNEACGALGSKDGRIVKNYPTANAAEHPDDFSEIDPQELLNIYNDID